MRNPSIHITKSEFTKILNDLEIKDFPTDLFFTRARKKSVDSRTVLVSNKRSTKKVNNILLANKGDASMVADIIYAIRIKLKHRGVRKINESNSREWANCKKLAEICNNFCQDFEFDNTREGFIKYIEIGISKLSSFRMVLTKLINMAEAISSIYESEQEILEDEDSDKTKAIHDYYIGFIASTTGITESYIDHPDKYIHFVRCRKFLEEHHWYDHQDFINAQFEALVYCNGIPSPESLYSDKAIERYNKWLYKNGTPDTSAPKVAGGLWDKIKGK